MWIVALLLFGTGTSLYADSAVTVTGVNLRPCPRVSRSCAPIVVLSAGTSIRVIEQRGEWSRVAAAGGEGWVNSKYIRISPARHEKVATFAGLPIKMPSQVTESELRFALLPVSFETFKSTVSIFSFLASFAFYFGLAILIGLHIGVRPQACIGVGIILTAIAGVTGVLPLNYIISVLAFGLFGVLLGGAGLGSSLRRGSAGGIAAGGLTVFLFIASFVAPNVLEIRCLLAVLLAVDAVIGVHGMSGSFTDGPDIFSFTLNGPFQLLALFGGFLVMPVLAPWWDVGQPLLFALGGLLGFAGGDLD